MTKNWLMLANRTGARLFENLGQGNGLRLIENFSHPEGRLKDQDYNSDAPGRSFDSHGQGRHSMEKGESPSEHENSHFAQLLADTLKTGREQDQVTHVYLVAEAGFLGDIRSAMDKKTLSVTTNLDKDLVAIEERDLPGHLEGLLKL